MSNKAVGDQLPAMVATVMRRAEQGAKTLFQEGEELKTSMIESGIVYVSTSGTPCVSLSNFRATFADIAHVIIGPRRTGWNNTLPAVCTCTIFGTQQQCHHFFFASSLPACLAAGMPAKDFGPAPWREGGRPTGKDASKPSRIHHGDVECTLL